jgi:hypothetical protein
MRRHDLSAIKIVSALLSLFAWCLTCAAQTTTVDIRDVSTVKCPIRMSGTVGLTESEANGEGRTTFVSHLSATNLSNQPIIAMVIYTSIGNSEGPLVGQNQVLDAFFAHDLEVAPGQTWNHQHDDDGVFSGPVSPGAVKIAPAASSQIVFVQFADGSTCGDSKDGRVQSLMDTRADLLLGLKKIDDAAKVDEPTFLKTLAEKATSRNAEGILNYIRDIQKGKGSPAAIAYIRSMLNVAASRY